MTHEDLLATRARVPGYLAAGIAASLFLDAFMPTLGMTSEEWLAAIGGTVVITALGWAYRSTGIQDFVYRHTWVTPVVRNITQKLLALVPSSDISSVTREKLLANGDLRSCFYKLIDGDESLKHKRSIVYANGAFLGAATDVFVLTVVALLAHMIKYMAVPGGNSPAWFLAWGALCLASMLCIPFSRLRHLRLSNDQLAFIRIHFEKEARECAIRAARQLEAVG